MSNPVEPSLVRIFRGDGVDRHTVGAGWLVSSRHCLTCAHVVNLALVGRTPKSITPPDHGQTIAFELPNLAPLPGAAVQVATVLKWYPPDNNAAPGAPADIAVLPAANWRRAPPATLVKWRPICAAC